MSYKKNIGEKLKAKRESLGYNKSTIKKIIGASSSTVDNIENGTAKDIDFYVKYAKAVDYKLKELMDVDITSLELNNVEVRIKTNLTKNIRDLIDRSIFDNYKSLNDIRNQLLSDKLINKSVKGSAISNVLNNLVKEKTLTKKKIGNNVHYKSYNVSN